MRQLIKFLRDHAIKKSSEYYKWWEEVEWIEEEELNKPCICIFVDHQARSLSLLADFDNLNIRKKIFFDHHHRIGIQTDEKDFFFRLVKYLPCFAFKSSSVADCSFSSRHQIRWD